LESQALTTPSSSASPARQRGSGAHAASGRVSPSAIRAVLRILGLEFTDAVPTLAVTGAERPLLKVNLGFLRAHCFTENHVKALLCHEFLHVLLRHTEERRKPTPARHLAFDAVINAIIHRQYGPAYSSMMARYYADAPGLQRLLRPMNDHELSHCDRCFFSAAPPLPQWARAWKGLYGGRLGADDLEALADDFARESAGTGDGTHSDPFQFTGEPIPDDGSDRLLGNHDELGGRIKGKLGEALDRAMREMNGAGIWRAPQSRGVGAHPYKALVSAADEPLRRWKRETLAVLRRHIVPDRRSRVWHHQPRHYRIPVLSVSDRRAFLRALWSPYLPEARWEGIQLHQEGTAQVYLDVSGSMNAEMPLIVGLLGQLSRYIRRPFWAFSDTVVPATIVNGQLRAATSGGICTRRPLPQSLESLVVEAGLAAGYGDDNWIDPRRYRVTSTVCQQVGDPTRWSTRVNDQSVVLGWAGYDPRTHYLPPEHFLAHMLRESLTVSCRDGRLRGQGPDGKLMVRLREDSTGWTLEQVLVTLQQREDFAFLELCEGVAATLADAYRETQERDLRWRAPWAEVDLMVNPNGPLVNGGSDGDNGQTGRKLVMDFYGPRIPIGGGALSGKHLSHIDRIGAYAARDAAVRAVQSGAKECLVRLAYVPNRGAPLDIDYGMEGRGERQPAAFFTHPEMIARYPANLITTERARGLHFFDDALPWNGGRERNAVPSFGTY
jgi:S-adenosylmethionine synthetase